MGGTRVANAPGIKVTHELFSVRESASTLRTCAAIMAANISPRITSSDLATILATNADVTLVGLLATSPPTIIAETIVAIFVGSALLECLG